MKRIAIVSEHASPLALAGSVDSGGQNVYVAQIARQFASAGCAVDIYTRRDDARLAEVVNWGGNLRIIHVPAGPPVPLLKEELLPYMTEFGAHLHRYFGPTGPGYDIVHANFFMSALAALPAARRHGIALAVTFHALGRVRRLHQGAADQFPDTRFEIEDYIVREADQIIAECPQDRQDLLELYGADPRRVKIVPCGYDPVEMAPMEMQAARAALGWDPGVFRVLQLGRMVPRKGIDNVIRGLALLRQWHGVEARLTVVGGESEQLDAQSTPELARLRAIAREEGVAPYVEFTGRRGRMQLRKYYCASNVFVTTPWYEPFGITPVEAMACARPVIGADTGGIRYTVKEGKTGFLVPPRDPAALAARLAQLAHNENLCRRMGEAGARRARRLFTWERVGDDLLKIFSRLQFTGKAAPSLQWQPAIDARALA